MKKAGVVINPGTPISQIEPILDIVDYVLVMTVNQGLVVNHLLINA